MATAKSSDFDPARGQRISEAMERLGMSDALLARLMWCDRASVHRWRQGHPISRDHLGRLIPALQMDPSSNHTRRSICDGEVTRSVDPETKRVGAELREARERAGVSLDQMARRFGKSWRTIRRLEMGMSQIRISDLNAYVEALGLPSVTSRLTISTAPSPDDRPPVPRVVSKPTKGPRGWAN